MKKIFCFILLLMVVGCGKKAPTDDQISDFYRALYSAWRGETTAEARQAVFDKAVSEIKDFDVAKITPAQADKMIVDVDYELDNSIKKWLIPIFVKQAEKSDLVGAQAAYAAFFYTPFGDPSQIEAYKNVWSHPGLKDWIDAAPDDYRVLISKMNILGVDNLQNAKVLPLIFATLDMDLPKEAIPATADIFALIFDKEYVPSAIKQEVRVKVLEKHKSILNKAELTDKDRAKIDTVCYYLQAPYATETLIDNPAPEINFLWNSNDNVMSLSGYKGKVVVLDFWSTKCGACVGIFPNIRALASRYKGYPVEILGVTSIHGYHIDIKNNRTIQTKGNPEKEMSLMKDFIKDMNMTWKVVFSDKSVYNPDYGVNGIPHIVIIDPQGVVRYNAIDPDEAPYLKAEKIDALLKESGLRAPENKMETKNYRLQE